MKKFIKTFKKFIPRLSAWKSSYTIFDKKWTGYIVAVSFPFNDETK